MAKRRRKRSSNLSEKAECVQKLFQKDSDPSGLVYPRTQREIAATVGLGISGVRTAICELETAIKLKIVQDRHAYSPRVYQLLPKRRVSRQEFWKKVQVDENYGDYSYSYQPLIDEEEINSILSKEDFTSFLRSYFFDDDDKLGFFSYPTPGLHLYQQYPEKLFWQCWFSHREELKNTGFQVIPLSEHPTDLYSIYSHSEDLWADDLWALYFNPHIFLQYLNKKQESR